MPPIKLYPSLGISTKFITFNFFYTTKGSKGTSILENYLFYSYGPVLPPTM